MCVLYRARHRGLNRLVALKLTRGYRARPDHFARLLIEAEAVARLKHPNIVQIHEIDEADGFPFLSMEQLEGRTATILAIVVRENSRFPGNPGIRV
jgi:serine/threonine-protein kinase